MRNGSLVRWCIVAAALSGCGGDDHSAPSAAPAARLAAVAHGETGSDDIRIQGYRANFTIVNAGGTVILTSKFDPSGAKTYGNLQQLRFVDRWVSFDINGRAGRIYRLYQAALNRQPDLTGLGYWIHAGEQGAALDEIAAALIDSAEFRSAYGDRLSNAAFLDRLYRNVLHRAGEAGGFNWWLAQLNAGAPRAQVLLGFAESDENRQALQPQMAGGIDYEPYGEGGPIVPQRTSYGNAKGLGIPAQQVPSFPDAPGQYAEGATGGVAFGDFLQTGKLSLVVFTNRWSHVAGQPNPVGAIHFYEYVDGAPVDVTSRLLQDTTGCAAPRRLLVADFNSDGKPDVFASCHGAETGPHAAWPGEAPRILLSQANGTYRNVVAPITCYCHAATAGDVDGDGNVDLIVSDSNGPRDGRASLIKLAGDGKGGFTVVRGESVDFINADANYSMHDKRYYEQYLTLELLDFDGDGKLDLFLGAGEQTTNSRILKGSGDGRFMTAAKVFPKTTADQHVIDIVYLDGTLYEYVTLSLGDGQYGNYAVRKYTRDMSSYQQLVSKPIVTGGEDFIFMMPYANTLVPYDAKYGVAVGL